jgi:alpha-galactosidase
MKPLEDGSYAVGMFNIDGFQKTPQSYFRWGDEKARSFTLDFSTLGLKDGWKIRDVWRQKDLGNYAKQFTTNIPHHGVVMIRMFPQ